MRREDAFARRNFGMTLRRGLVRNGWTRIWDEEMEDEWTSPSGQRWDFPLLRDLFIVLAGAKIERDQFQKDLVEALKRSAVRANAMAKDLRAWRLQGRIG